MVSPELRRPLQAVMRIAFSLAWAHLAAVVFCIVLFVALGVARGLLQRSAQAILEERGLLVGVLVAVSVVSAAALLGGCVTALLCVTLGSWRMVVPPLVILLLTVTGFATYNPPAYVLLPALSGVPASVVGSYVGILLRPGSRRGTVEGDRHATEGEPPSEEQ